METIIQQIMEPVLKNLIKNFYSEQNLTLDEWANISFEECKKMAIEIAQVCCDEMNLELRKNKKLRKTHQLVIKEKDRKRNILTKLGNIEITRDYYYDKNNNCYTVPIDRSLGIQAYKRISENVCAELVEKSTEYSYAKSSQIVTGNIVSRQSVRNSILRVNLPNEQEKVVTKKNVQELHIYADEDHVHLQKPNKEKGKKIQIVPLVSVTEGTLKENGRNKTINPVHFVNEEFKAKELWKEVDSYIQRTYDVSMLEKIYIHADGGKWIQNGLEDYALRCFVMDGFHLERELKEISRIFPKKNIRFRLTNAILENNKEKASKIFKEMLQESSNEKEKDRIIKKALYFLNHWETIVNRKILNIPGSCTEGQVSHILSKRFSREPQGWSKEGLGKLSALRVYVKNGGKIRGKDFRPECIEDNTLRKELTKKINAKLDWSIFEKEEWTFNQNSGTQMLLKTICMGGIKKIC